MDNKIQFLVKIVRLLDMEYCIELINACNSDHTSHLFRDQHIPLSFADAFCGQLFTRVFESDTDVRDIWRNCCAFRPKVSTKL